MIKAGDLVILDVKMAMHKNSTHLVGEVQTACLCDEESDIMFKLHPSGVWIDINGNMPQERGTFRKAQDWEA